MTSDTTHKIFSTEKLYRIQRDDMYKRYPKTHWNVQWIPFKKSYNVISTFEIVFYKNGVSQGTAFEGVWSEVYYPAASLYKAATVEFNFGPSFAFPPPSDLGSDVVKPVSDLATPPPKPEGVEAGAGESSKAGEGENAGEEAEEAEGEGDEMDDAM